jgi:mono/diheme cytochrome c family protein
MEKRVRWRWTALLTLWLLIAAVPAAAQTLAGDSARGEDFYVGTRSFEKGGSPCLACHAIAGAGLGKAAGASYGPDLTEMWENFGEEGVIDILEVLEIFPSMEALYVDRPLTGPERADLAAFFQDVSGRETPQIAGSLLLEAGAGIGVFFLILAIFGRNRLKTERPCPCANIAKK